MTNNKNILLFLTILAFASPSLALQTVLLKNGDIITGDILERNQEQVRFKSPTFGTVTLQAADIQEIRPQTNHDTQTEAAGTTVATTAPTEQTQGTTGNPSLEEEKSVVETKDTWSGQAGLSLAMRESIKSNAGGVTGTDKSATYRFYGNMGWESPKNKLRWNWTYRYSEDEYDKQDDYFNVTQQYTHDFKENYYATAKTMYQRDFRRKIDNEYLQTAEMGIKWTPHPDFEFSTSAGGGYHQYDRTTYNSTTQQDAEQRMTQPKFILDESLRWQIINSLTLIQKYTHLGDLTDYHFVFTAGVENKLIHDVFLRLEYRLDRDTEVYYDDRGYYDKALLTSLLYKF